MLKLIALLALMSMPVAAQILVPVGELLDKGAKKIEREELQALLKGATVSGIQRARPDIKFSLKHNDDGSTSGSAQRVADNLAYTRVSGTWRVNEKGQHCSDLRNSFGDKPEGTGSCNYYFKLGDTYWQAATDDRGDTAIERDIKK